jgi:Cu+-exporting ATPase
MASTTPPSTEHLAQVELSIGGMTCASCVARVERKLNKLDGVTASVNLATQQAKIEHPAEIPVDRLVSAVEAAGYSASPATSGQPEPTGADDEEDTHTAQLRQQFLVSALLGVPVIVLSMVPAWQFAQWQWLALTLTAPVVVWGAWPFHLATARNLRHGTTTMDPLVSMGVAVAFAWSLYALFLGHAGMPGLVHEFSLAPRATNSADIYLEVAVGVTVFLLLGRWLEARAKRRAGAALRALLHLGASEATVLQDGQEHQVPVDRLRVGDEFVVRPGEKIAADGVVVRGSSAVDKSMLTGESVPEEVHDGDEVVGGTLNSSGRLVVRAKRVGADTELARMTRLVTEAQVGKAQVQRLADRISSVFVPVVLILAVLTVAGWLLAERPVDFAMTAAVTVLVVACPCALGLATPTALLVGTGRGAQLGLLVKGPEVLESTRRVNAVLLDKTGTVTSGRMTVAAVVTGEGYERDDVLRVAGALEAWSEHPIARAIYATARAEIGALPDVEEFRNIEGLGVTARLDGGEALVGRAKLLHRRSLSLSDALAEEAQIAERKGRTVVAVAARGQVIGLVAMADQVKPSSTGAVRQMRALGLRPMLLTGDNTTVAMAVAREVSIEQDDVIAEVLPDGKVDTVRRLQDEGWVVAVIGDGVNDAPALAVADLGIAIGTGTDVAIEAGDITLVRGDVRAAADAIRLSRRTLSTIKGNLFWAFAYNVAALPIAAAGLLNPMLAGAAMALSSVFVVTNSLRLRGFRPSVNAA